MNEQFVNELATALRKVGTIHTVGEEWVSYIGEIPVGGVPYCGQEVTRATYSALWSYAQAKGLVKTEAEWQQLATANNGNVPFYSSGDGSTTFRMPKIVGYVKGASSQSESGSYVKEGLPNITGHVYSVDWQIAPNLNGNGALLVDASVSSFNKGGQSTTTGSKGFAFDASRSNPIYGNSSHVTPETSVVMFGVYAFGAIVETGELDASTLATGLARVESNLEAKLEKTIVHIVETWSNGSNWYRKWSDGWIEQGGITTSESNFDPLTFPTAFTNTNYSIVGSLSADTMSDSTSWSWYSRKTTAITGRIFTIGLQGMCYYMWYACGY